jgi:Protein of unknown function, DUF547
MPMRPSFIAWISAFVLLMCGSLLAQPAAGQGFDHNHAAFTTLLKRHVVVADEGRSSTVNYAAFQKDRALLKGYLDMLSAVSETEFKSWNKAQRMAFLINAYNAFTVELILQHYPVKSIKDIGGLLDNRWKRKFFRLFGKDATLDMVEHDMLRQPGAYDEVRVHYAVNCASIGCPMLREEAFVAARLDRQLEEQASRFLSDRSRNRFANGTLQISQIFKWFAEDWSRGYRGWDGKTMPVQSREEYFSRYAKLFTDKPEEQAIIASGKVKIDFLDYDWSINAVK